MIEGKNLDFRYVEESDAEFIISLRTNPKLGQHIHATSSDVSNQVEWIKKYKLREKENKEHYFIIQDKTGKQLGTIRIYDIRGNSFCWGSWVISPDAPKSTAIESALMIYEFAFYNIGFAKSHFDVRKDNNSVWAFHERMGAKKSGETEIDYLYDYYKEDYEEIKPRYKRYLK